MSSFLSHHLLRSPVPAAALLAGALLLSAPVARAEPPAGAMASPVPSPLAFSLGVPLVRVLADRPGVGVYRAGYSEPLCVAPCNQRLDGRDGTPVYFGGPGIRPSEPWALERMYGEARFRVQAGSRAKAIAGLVLAITGVSAAGLGGVGLGTTMLASGGDGALVGAYIAGVVGGLVALVTGVSLRQRNETKVVLSSSTGSLGLSF